MLNIAVLVSGGGTNLQALIDAEKAGKIENGRISVVVASKPGVYALERARNAGIEGVVLALFGFGRQRRNWLVFLLVNLVTQGGLALWTARTCLLHGLGAWSVLALLPAELVIFPAEMAAYALLLRGQPRSRSAAYGFLANLFSAVLGFLAIQPVWTFIQSIL